MDERLWIIGRIQDQSSVGARLFESCHLAFKKLGSRKVTGPFHEATAQ